MAFNFFHVLLYCSLLLLCRSGRSDSCRLSSNMDFIFDSLADQNRSLILNCSSTRVGKHNRIVEWKKNGKVIENRNLTLFKRNVTRNDTGKYECTLAEGEVHKETCSIVVGASPYVTLKMSDQFTDRKYRPILNCTVNGYPEPNITWYRNGKVVDNMKEWSENDWSEKEWSGRDGLSFWWAFPLDMAKTDHSNFTCKAENKFGIQSKITRASTCIEVEALWKCPSFNDIGDVNITVDMGTATTVMCPIVFAKDFAGCYEYGIRYSCDNSSDYKPCLKTLVVKKEANISVRVAATRNASGTYTCFISKLRPELPSHCAIDQSKSFHLFVRESYVALQMSKKDVKIAVAVSVVGALLGLGLTFVVCFLRKKKLKSQRFYDSLPEIRWDVFVSYSSKDFPWVKELCETLEEAPFNLAVCLHQRGWEAGRTVIDNMADSVYCSQKTLLIVSKSYVESTYCMQELQIALHSETESRTHKDRILLIKLDDVSLKKLPKALRQKSYLDFSDNEQRKHFKKKLLKALPKHDLTDDTQEDNNSCLSTSTDNVRLDEMNHHQTEPLV